MSQHPLYCPWWEYSDVPNHDELLLSRTRSAMMRIRPLSHSDKLQLTRDTRIFHRNYFQGLTPPSYDYYAGNYRGSDFTCLKFSSVVIKSDPRVGHPPGMVKSQMEALDRRISEAITECNYINSINEQLLPPENKLFRIVEVAASLFVYFLEIHPYMNGNGHMGRLILISFLGVYGIYLARWPVHPRPQDPPYSQAIADHRRGNDRPLIHFILACI